MLRLQGVITAFFKPQECQQQDGRCSELRTGTFAPAKMPVRMKVLKHFKLTSVERFSWIFLQHELHVFQFQLPCNIQFQLPCNTSSMFSVSAPLQHELHVLPCLSVHVSVHAACRFYFLVFSSLATFSFSSLATRAPCFQFQLPCNTSSMFCLVFQFTFQFTQLAGFTS